MSSFIRVDDKPIRLRCDIEQADAVLCFDASLLLGKLLATAGPHTLIVVNSKRSLRGLRLITLLVPCLDGWGAPEDQGIALARLAVQTGVFPLYEVEDGTRYMLNEPRETRPARDYLMGWARLRLQLQSSANGLRR